MEKVWYLSQIDIFQGIPEREIMELASRARDRRCTCRTHLYGPHDDEDRQVYILKEGEVVLYHSREGKRIIFDVLGPGTVFGNFLSDLPNTSHFSEALPGSRVCTLTTEDFQRVIAVHPEIIFRLLTKLSQRLKDYEERLKLDMGSARERVVGELHRYRRKKLNPFSRVFGFSTPLYVTHEKLAELTGLNRVTVTRTLKLLEEEGRISVDRSSGAISLVYGGEV